MPFLCKKLIQLADRAVNFGRAADTHLMHDGYDGGVLSQCRLMILTINFCNTVHTDKNDLYDKDHIAAVKGAHQGKPSQDAVNNILQRYEDAGGFGVATSCGYQFIEKDPASKTKFKQTFCLQGLGLAIELPNFSGITFFGHLFAHNTAIPLIYHEDGRIQIADKRNGHMVFAWGAGNNEKKKRGRTERQDSSSKRRKS